MYLASCDFCDKPVHELTPFMTKFRLLIFQLAKPKSVFCAIFAVDLRCLLAWREHQHTLRDILRRVTKVGGQDIVVVSFINRSTVWLGNKCVPA